jgi:hypothetical protein
MFQRTYWFDLKAFDKGSNRKDNSKNGLSASLDPARGQIRIKEYWDWQICFCWTWKIHEGANTQKSHFDEDCFLNPREGN